MGLADRGPAGGSVVELGVGGGGVIELIVTYFRQVVTN